MDEACRNTREGRRLPFHAARSIVQSLIPACRNSGSVTRRRLRTSGPIRRGSISQRRLLGSHRPPAFEHPRIKFARAADCDQGAEHAELGRADAGR